MPHSDVRITILVDNNAAEGLGSEHGFALWIETAGTRILFDTGKGAVLNSNAAALGVDLSATAVAVLSHGHYDHTGGVASVLRAASRAVVCCHRAALRRRYSVSGGASREIGMPEDAALAIQNLPSERIRWADLPLRLTHHVGVTDSILRQTPFEDTGGAFFLDPAGTMPDPIEDDIALWIETGEGIVLCVGCSHSGIINTLAHVRQITAGRKVRAVIGGMHLLNAENTRLKQTFSSLRERVPDILVPCHCTGQKAAVRLKEAFGECVVPGAAGMKFDF